MLCMSARVDKKLFIKTWGCQMNVYDSNRMADILRPFGYRPADTPDDADMVILNTCHIREKATDKVFSDLGRLRPLKDKKEAAGGQMVMANVGENGGLELDKDFYIEFPKGYRSHQIRLEGGDCSTDSFCYPSV